MPQFFVPPENIRNNSFFFNETESRHLIKVLRKKKGDIIKIFDGENPVHFAKITDISDQKKVKGEIISPPSPQGKRMEKKGYILPNDKIISLNIYPSLIKNERFEWIIEKLTELGVSSIHPVITERTIIHIDSKKISSKTERWEKIILASAKQCGCVDLPKIFPPVSFDETIKRCHSGRSEESSLSSPPTFNLILWENEEKNILSEYCSCLIHQANSDKTLDKSSNYNLNNKFTFNLFIGPEGGYTLKEIESAQKAGIVSVGLGDQILRAETAAIAAASIILL